MAQFPSVWETQIKDQIRQRYARQAVLGGLHQCATRQMVEAGYSKEMIDLVPVELQNAFSGCGCPVADLTLNGDEVVVDLGSGAGIDSFLVAKMLTTGAMIAIDLTWEVQQFLRQHTQGVSINSIIGDIERLPLKDCTADIIIANASFNLTIDKETAYREALRILKPRGKLAVWDLVRNGELPKEVLENPLALTTSLGGVVEEVTIQRALETAGFTEIKITKHSQYSFVIAVSITARRSGP